MPRGKPSHRRRGARRRTTRRTDGARGVKGRRHVPRHDFQLAFPNAGGNKVYFLVSGHAHVLIASPAREVILGDVRDGDFVGELRRHPGRYGRCRRGARGDLSRVGAADRLIVSPPPTHVELAARVGVCREVVTKLLSAMRSEGTLQSSPGALTFIEPDRLREIAAEAEQGRPL